MNIIKMSLMTLYAELEKIIRQQIWDSYPSDWREDYITRKILFEYRKLFRNIQIQGLSSLDFTINSVAYKFTGNLETQFGDIGFLVRIKYPDNSIIEGVTSLEAKIKHKKTRRFQEIKGRQLQTISANIKYPMLLMYDYQPIEKVHDYSFFPSTTKQNYAAVVPINVVYSIIRDVKPDFHNQDKNNKTPVDAKTIYKFSVPLAYQIIFRYFRGLDLDFDHDLVKYIKGYEFEEGNYRRVIEERSLPQYLLCISVDYGELESYIDMDFGVNINFFSEITSSEPEDF
ncbi:MAG TPA: hypothetical protein VK203_17480 [Nostocaceae cyanobacterium]|nr:hypothetical protein [Nostocaceae cyanobacterium]